MKLQITPKKTLAEIQNDFQHAFPLLKIEFFKKPHRIGKPSSKKDLMDNTLKVSQVTDAQGEITITGKMKISGLEQQLHKQFGLDVQVFRKGGKVWIETSSTDDTTLQQQQTSAKEAQIKYTYSMHTFSDERD